MDRSNEIEGKHSQGQGSAADERHVTATIDKADETQPYLRTVGR